MYTTDVRRTRRSLAWLAVPAAVVTATLAFGAPADAASPSPASASSYTSLQAAGGVAQGIIMRDGGVCDPIRHMGC